MCPSTFYPRSLWQFPHLWTGEGTPKRPAEKERSTVSWLKNGRFFLGGPGTWNVLHVFFCVEKTQDITEVKIPTFWGNLVCRNGLFPVGFCKDMILFQGDSVIIVFQLCDFKWDLYNYISNFLDSPCSSLPINSWMRSWEVFFKLKLEFQ